ncbi:MAG: prepilin-type N-terminal cleavage/methylation domain-containing protein [Synechococcales bacterium]|nr:prepilin-type N-terminal cleavage/methylation domain-containing protein [Synechococcales bacterium]
MQFKWRNPQQTESGFTLLEIVIIFAIMAILSAIAIPSYLQWLRISRLNFARDQVAIGLKQANYTARQTRLPHRFMIKPQGDRVVWAIAPILTDPNPSGAINWNMLPEGIQIDRETTLLKPSNQDYYTIQFSHYGEVNGQLGRVTLSFVENEKTKRCAIVSTLLGEVRSGSDRPTKQNDKYCY